MAERPYNNCQLSIFNCQLFIGRQTDKSEFIHGIFVLRQTRLYGKYRFAELLFRCTVGADAHIGPFAAVHIAGRCASIGPYKSNR